MMDPRYQEVKRATIPEVTFGKDVRVRVVAGEVNGVRGPVEGIVVEPEYLDVRVGPGGIFEHPVKRGHTAFAYVLGGRGTFDEETGEVDSENLVTFRDGDRVAVRAATEPLRFLLISGRPIGEPVAWWGPIVMNTRQELETAIEEYQAGTFIKRGNPRRPFRQA